MAQFSKQPLRYDPYKNFKFRVKFGTSPDYVAGVSKVSALKRTTEVVEHREGGDPEHVAQISRAQQVRGHHAGTRRHPRHRFRGLGQQGVELQRRRRASNRSLADFRKDIIIDVFNEAGQKVKSYHVFRCWVSEYQATSDFDANANAVLIEHIKIENEGWQRDVSVTEPTPAQFDPVVG